MKFNRFPIPPRSVSGAWALSLAFILLIAPTLRAASLAQLQSLVAQLASDNPRLRQSALNSLTEVSRKDFPLLRAAALSQTPLLPGQVAAIRQIVMQTFLATEKYHVDPEVPGGFLGLRWTNPNLRPTPDGVVVDERIPGFPAYLLFQSGDVIVQIAGHPPVQLLTTLDLVHAVQLMWPGEVLHLKVLRLNRLINVSIVLDFLPVDINAGNIDAWIEDRNQKAQAYWDEEFSIIDPSSPPDPGQARASAAQ